MSEITNLAVYCSVVITISKSIIISVFFAKKDRRYNYRQIFLLPSRYLCSYISCYISLNIPQYLRNYFLGTVPVFRQFITFKVLILPTIPPTFISPTIAPLFEQFIMYLLSSENPTIPPT